MIDAPPALVGLIHLFPVLSFWPFVTLASICGIRYVWNIVLSKWVVAILCFLSLPTSYKLRTELQERRYRHDAEARHAILAPKVEGGELQTARAIWTGVQRSIRGTILYYWSEIYGSVFRLHVAGEETLFTSEPEHVKAILVTQFDAFMKGPALFDQWRELFGSGIFATDGQASKLHRALARPFFTRDRISDFDIFDKHAATTIAVIKERLCEGFPVDFQDAISRFTLDSATEYLFDKNVHSLDCKLPYQPWSGFCGFDKHPSNVFSRAFGRAQNLAAQRARVGAHFRLYEPFRNNMITDRKVIDEFIKPILDVALAKKRAGTRKTDETTETFLDHLVNKSDDAKAIMDSVINILVAARDTTAATLTFAVYMLAEQPDVRRKLRQEILDKVGPTERPTFEHLKEMPYLHAFLNETMRLFPALPFNARTACHSVLLPPAKGATAPYYVPAGTRCIYSIFHMHRRKDLWGTDALDFDPDRFIDERLQKYYASNPYIFAPFNTGPRVCLGQQFAYNEMSFFLVRLLQRFSTFSLDPESLKAANDQEEWSDGREEKIRIKTALAISVKNGLWVHAKEADSNSDA